jgi:hypothetical protein
MMFIYLSAQEIIATDNLVHALSIAKSTPSRPAAVRGVVSPIGPWSAVGKQEHFEFELQDLCAAFLQKRAGI